MKNKITYAVAFLLVLACACSSSKKGKLLGLATSGYPNRPSVTNGGWLMLWAESGVTNYNQTFTQLTNQMWKAVLGPTNYGVSTFIGGQAFTNFVLSPSSFQTNYTLSVTNAVEQEIVTADTNVNLIVAADRAHTPSVLWVNALTSTVGAVVTPPLTARTNIGFVSTVTNGTARAYRIEYRGGVYATNLYIIHKEVVQ